MKKLILALMLAAGSTQAVHAQKTVMVGGAAMYPTKNIIENAVNSKDHTTLVAAVKAAELAGVLSGKGPFTVFAPTNAAFDALPAGTVDGLLQPEAKPALQSVLKYHVVAGKWSAKELKKMIRDNGGKATIETVQGGKIYASLDEQGNPWIWDESGSKAMVTQPDVFQSNGVIHVIDHVLLPKM